MSIVLSTRCWICMKRFKDESDKCHMLNNTTGEDAVCKTCFKTVEPTLSQE